MATTSSKRLPSSALAAASRLPSSALAAGSSLPSAMAAPLSLSPSNRRSGLLSRGGCGLCCFADARTGQGAATAIYSLRETGDAFGCFPSRRRSLASVSDPPRSAPQPPSHTDTARQLPFPHNNNRGQSESPLLQPFFTQSPLTLLWLFRRRPQRRRRLLPTPAAQVFTGDERPPGSPLISGTMGTSAQESPLWKQIDDAEYYLVSGSFEQAMLAALSVADQIRTASLESTCDQDELLELFESAGMVLVQALKELRRTPEMFVQLKTMFGSVASVPARVFLTGATIQMAAGSVSDLKPVFEEYLANWRYANDEVYVLDGGHGSASNGFVVTSVMSTGQYFQVAELYTVTFLCIVSQDSETAISWAEKADLTEQSRQDLLKKLHAVRLAANKKLSAVEGVKQTAERNLSTSTNGSTPLPHEDPPKKIAPVCDGLKKVLVKSAQPSEHVANQFDPLFWWFHSIRLKFGKMHIVLPSGKLMFLFSLLFSTMYVLRRKTAGLKRTVFQQASSLRRAFLDALQLAFSVQMNPLAAVQQVPQAPRGSWL